MRGKVLSVKITQCRCRDLLIFNNHTLLYVYCGGNYDKIFIFIILFLDDLADDVQFSFCFCFGKEELKLLQNLYKNQPDSPYFDEKKLTSHIHTKIIIFTIWILTQESQNVRSLNFSNQK